MKWFKFYGQDYLSDPKMLSLSACERSCWITLLSYSSVNDNGMITFLSEEQLMMQAGISFQHEEWDYTTGVLKKLESLGMITNDNGMITVKNWSKRQETSLTSYERVKRFRQKKQEDNAKITLEENRRDKKRIDKNIILGDTPPTPSEEARSFFEGNVDKILGEFMNKGLDNNILRGEFTKFILYWTEKNKSGTKQRWETEKTFEVKRRLNTWLNNIKNFSTKKETKIL